MRPPLVVVLVCAGCIGDQIGQRSGVGESCASTKDCVDDAVCRFDVCVARDGGAVDGAPDMEPRPVFCVLGRSVPCACAGGASGAQTCLGPEGYGPCECGEPRDPDGAEGPLVDGGPPDSSLPDAARPDALPDGPIGQALPPLAAALSVDVELVDRERLGALGCDLVAERGGAGLSGIVASTAFFAPIVAQFDVWPPGGRIGAARVNAPLMVYDVLEVDEAAGTARIRPASRAPFREARVEAGVLDTGPRVLRLQLGFVDSGAYLLRMDRGRIVGSIRADAPGFSLEGRIEGYVTAPDLFDWAVAARNDCLIPPSPAFCALVGPGIFTADALRDALLESVGGYDARLEGGEAVPCGDDGARCDALGMCLRLTMSGVRVVE